MPNICLLHAHLNDVFFSVKKTSCWRNKPDKQKFSPSYFVRALENIYVHKLIGFDRANYIIVFQINSESHRNFSLFDTVI